ncbi:unnamed protein product [Adineta steineri]|uniref:Protein-glucosylgalactosylhydroxylysine glucosidase n=1 Tax=Adineta steineri TaxID=433720 RepID=A0A814R4G9_9BILA|nr:unnamed protein product [Adineta steineri]CAF3924246.1 unnamed protein product [Adineta steineri]
MSLNKNKEGTFFQQLCACDCNINPCTSRPYTKRQKILIAAVVILIIIVILAAILIPVFILTRKKTTDSPVSTTVFTTTNSPVSTTVYTTTNSPISTTVFTTDKLPSNGTSIDYRIMPYVGNGHIATVVFSDFIYMNGLYNGENGTSHRARIPSTHNWQFNTKRVSASYSLDVETGTFTERFDDDIVRIERRIFASQEYTELLLTHVTITRLTSEKQTIVVPVEVTETLTSADFKFDVVSRDDKHVLLSGKTLEVENSQYQQDILPLFIYYTPLPFNGLQLDAEESARTFLFVTSLDTDQARAKRSFDYASTERQPDQLWSAHVDLWKKVWSNGRIEVRDDAELQRQINSAYYYILSSLPPLSTKSEHKQFYGLSPGTLSRGGLLGEDYGGHSFWDTETWMYPSVLLFYPTLAKEILSYRIGLREAAADNAPLFGYEGWRFPWESARTGVDVTPDCCPEVRLYQMHITGDIAFAARQYVAATGDQNWLKSEMGGDLIYETARFWASRVTYNPNRDQYDILMVLPPDEDAQPFKDNSVFTNAVASFSIQLADLVSCITDKPVPQQWLNISNNLHFPFDNSAQIHLEYEGFNPKNSTIKQADVVLLGFPLMWPMTKEVRKNDLLTYEAITRDDGPAMTWSMHAIGFLELEDFESAEKLFRQSYETYVRQPFNVWTEARAGVVGAVNFITGAGGFLQAVLYGYGGIRLTMKELEIMPPARLPNQSTGLVFHGLKYYGATLDLTIENSMYHLNVRELNVDSSRPLIYQNEQKRDILKVGDYLSFPIKTRLIIQPETPLCP